jgi:hypothetical protein
LATTVTAPVTNTIALASRYLPNLDEIYKASSKTAILDTANERVRWEGAKTAYLFHTAPVGLANYSRNAGFVPGDVTGSWEPYTIEQDRGRSFMIDVMDNDETLGMAFGTLVGEFERTQVIPELDAYRFAKYASGAAAAQVITETLSAGAATIASIDGATAALDDAEVPYEGRILFVNPTTYRLIKSGVTRMVMNGDNNVNYNVEMYNDMRLITVPTGRFNTAVTLNAPTTSAAAGGYTASGDAINYMIVHPSAVLQVVKHAIPRIFSPEVNQEADAWKFDYRVYHDCFIEAQKTNGIYVSHA